MKTRITIIIAIIFAVGIFSQATAQEEERTGMGEKTQQKKIRKEIPVCDGCITLAELFANKKDYEGETVTLRGKVTKFSAQIMAKNWIHLQDGTEADGRWDITVTTKEEFKVGDIITIEGKIVLEQDFGHGYYYKILMEEAVSVAN